MKRHTTIRNLMSLGIALGLVTGGVTTARAQSNVYSLNVVGYVNLFITNGYNFVANQLDLEAFGISNTLNSIIGTTNNQARPDTAVYVWDVTNQVFLPPSTYSDAEVSWDPNYNLPVGKGFVVWSDTNWTLTIVGEVLQGSLSNFIAGTNKLSLLAFQVPIPARLSTDLSFPAADGDEVYLFDSSAQSFTDAFTYFSGFGWFAAEPTNNVGQSFFIRHPGPDTTWAVNFTVQDAQPPALEAARVRPLIVRPPLMISGMSIGAGWVTITLPGSPGSSYGVQFSTDRVSWTTVANNLTGTAWTGPSPSSRKGYYRLVLMP